MGRSCPPTRFSSAQRSRSEARGRTGYCRAPQPMRAARVGRSTACPHADAPFSGPMEVAERCALSSIVCGRCTPCERWPPCSACKPADCAATCAPVWCPPNAGSAASCASPSRIWCCCGRAEGLVTRRIPPRRVHARLPAGCASGWARASRCSGMQVEAEGRSVVVSDGEQRWEPSSGQVVFDFEPGASGRIAGSCTSCVGRPPARRRRAAGAAPPT